MDALCCVYLKGKAVFAQNFGYVQHTGLLFVVHTSVGIYRRIYEFSVQSLQWRHNGRDSVSNHQPCECLLSRLIRRKSKKTSRLRVTGLYAGNSPETGDFPAQRASNAENVTIWWRHHDDWERHQQKENGARIIHTHPLAANEDPLLISGFPSQMANYAGILFFICYLPEQFLEQAVEFQAPRIARESAGMISSVWDKQFIVVPVNFIYLCQDKSKIRFKMWIYL